jgi:hypothetical protein
MTTSRTDPFPQAADEYPLTVGYITGIAVMLVVLTGTVLVGLHLLALDSHDRAAENRLDRRPLFVPVVVMRSGERPVTLAVPTRQMPWRRS